MRICGGPGCINVLPARTKGGHREREYCSDRCRKRASRIRQKEDQEFERLTEGMYALLPDQQVRRDEWRFERPRLLQACKLLQLECNVAQAEARLLRSRLEQAEEEILLLRSLLSTAEHTTDEELANAQAEIVRLTTLLEGSSKLRKHD
jgi:hypothetical protein